MLDRHRTADANDTSRRHHDYRRDARLDGHAALRRAARRRPVRPYRRPPDHRPRAHARRRRPYEDPEGDTMNALTRFVLDHKRLVVGFWLAVTVAAFAAIGPAGSALSQQFTGPGSEGLKTNKELAATFG